jgi:uncharacterized protein (TIGR03792 family)
MNPGSGARLPEAVELLVFHVPVLEQSLFLERDRALWTAALTAHPGFAGKRIWKNSERDTEILVTVGWENRESWKSFPPSLQRRLEREFGPFSRPSEEVELWPEPNPLSGKGDQDPGERAVFFHDGIGALQLWIFQVPRNRHVQFKELVLNLWLRKVSLREGFRGTDLFQNPEREEEVWVAIGWRDGDDWRRLPNALFSGFHRHTLGMIEDRRYVELVPLGGTVPPNSN